MLSEQVGDDFVHHVSGGSSCYCSRLLCMGDGRREQKNEYNKIFIGQKCLQICEAQLFKCLKAGIAKYKFNTNALLCRY